MEVYILDSLLRRDTVVDIFESVIWTERFRDIDDFELTVQSTPVHRMRVITGNRLAVNVSDRVMTVETVEDATDQSGKKVLKIKGRGLEAILEDRIILGQTAPYQLVPGYLFSGTPIDVMMQMFTRCCVNGEIHPNDPLPFYVPGGTLYPPDGIAAPADNISIDQDPVDLFTALKNLGDVYDLGIRLYRDPEDQVGGKLYFNVYTGSDRSMQQNVFPPVVFSSDLENLQNTRELETIEKAKNVAYSFYQYTTQETTQDTTVDPPVSTTVDVLNTMYEIVYAEGMDPNAAGFDRHETYVKIDKIPEDVTDIPAFLIRQGKDALAKARPSSLLDGEVNEYSPYKYKLHYFLGDIVTMQNSDGAANSMRVTEQIFVDDDNGERSYPTMIINQFIDPGAWVSWNYNRVWADMGATEYWNIQP